MLMYHYFGPLARKILKQGVTKNMLICRAYITLKDGTRLYAKDVGKKAFCWEVSEEEYKEYLEKKQNKKDKQE